MAKFMGDPRMSGQITTCFAGPVYIYVQDKYVHLTPHEFWTCISGLYSKVNELRSGGVLQTIYYFN